MLAKYGENKAAQMVAKWLTSLDHNILTTIDRYATTVHLGLFPVTDVNLSVNTHP